MTATGISEGQPGHLIEGSSSLLGEPSELSSPIAQEAESVAQLPSVSEYSLEENELTFLENPVSIVEPDGLPAMGEAAQARGYMWIPLAAPGPQHRGRLGLYIEDSIETLLEERGALPPGIQASTGLDASLSDQLYRARLVEMRGIALGIPCLEGITNLGRALDAEDSAVLRWWMAATADRPVRVLISRDNTKLRVYPSPVLFETLFDVAPAPVTPMPPVPSMAQSAETMELSELPPAAQETNVLGTQVGTAPEPVAPLEEDAEPEPLFGGPPSEEQHVDLPDLDRALGLTSEKSSDPTESHESLSSEKSNKNVDAPEQLALDYDSSQLPRTVHAPPQSPEVLVKAESLADFDEETSGRSSLTEPAREASLEDESTLDSDEIDANEFLRTLAEDSSRVPDVSGETEDLAPAREEFLDEIKPPRNAESGDQVPLPTKKIARSPFIRMVDPSDAVADEQLPSDLTSDSLETVEEKDGSADRAVASTTIEGVPLKEPEPAETASPSPDPDPEDPFNQLALREWKTWKSNLEAARGPKPLSVIERMFVTDYTRLREAVRRGVADTSANEILDEWRDSFTGSYSEAFDALRVRGKRPTMVLDLPELAARLGRLQGARRVQLLLVDGMRFDLGLMIQQRMRKSAEAALTERLLLWSALPTVTSYQLELLGKGPDGLKEQGRLDEPPALVARGEAARTARRVRTGSLELLKLDVVADSLRLSGAPVFERMDSIADDASDAIVAHMSKLPPRTMVVVFGDHGFALDPTASGTTEEVKQGGASPEEVLVPAFAWLTGQVH